MANIISYYKVARNEYGELEVKAVTLAGIANEGVVIEAGKLNNELSDCIQYFYTESIRNKLANAVTKYEDAKNNFKHDIANALESVIDEYETSLEMLENISTPAKSEYAFVNRIALAILNSKEYHLYRETELYKTLKISGYDDNIEMLDLSNTRKAVIEIMNDIFEIRDCPYIKPVQVKLNLKETSQLIAIANNTRTRWTNKGIKTRISKTIETDVALQTILFVCKNCFKMVIPVKKATDDRDTI